jgi:hypothetical protein
MPPSPGTKNKPRRTMSYPRGQYFQLKLHSFGCGFFTLTSVSQNITVGQ